MGKSDDIQTSEIDLEKLYEAYIKKIDQLRSLASSQPFGGEQITGSGTQSFVSLSGFNESRVHAFYRYLGFPVLGQNDSFYNPGFDPLSSSTARAEKKQAVKTGFDQSSIKSSVLAREDSFVRRMKIFASQDSSASAYSLCLAIPRNISLIDPDKDTLDTDLQTEFIKERQVRLEDIKRILNTIDSNLIASIVRNQDTILKPSHILKPFIVDPVVESSVQPVKNRVCVPFVPSKGAYYEPNKKLSRSGLELIIKERLLAPKVPKTEIISMAAELSGITAETGDEVESFITGANLTSDLIEDLDNLSEVQFSRLLDYSKQIVQLMKELDKNIASFDELNSGLSFNPIPPSVGPEYKLGAIVKTFPGTGSTEEKVIVTLKLQQLLKQESIISAQDKGIDTEDFGLGETIKRDVSKELTSRQREFASKKDKFLSTLRNIEIISGEVSGLGLIDIIAIYTALWAIDISTLVSFLDDIAWARLQEVPELKRAIQGLSESSDPEQIAEVSSGVFFNSIQRVPITTALKNFQDKLVNILNFAQDCFINKSWNTIKQETGKPQ